MNNYFLVKVRYEKKQGVSFLVQARTIEEARNTIVDAMKKTMIDYDMVEIERAEHYGYTMLVGEANSFIALVREPKDLTMTKEGTLYCISCQKEVQ